MLRDLRLTQSLMHGVDGFRTCSYTWTTCVLNIRAHRGLLCTEYFPELFPHFLISDVWFHVFWSHNYDMATDFFSRSTRCVGDWFRQRRIYPLVICVPQHMTMGYINFRVYTPALQHARWGIRINYNIRWLSWGSGSLAGTGFPPYLVVGGILGMRELRFGFGCDPLSLDHSITSHIFWHC